MNPNRLHDDSARNPDDYARGRPLARPIPTVPDPSDPSQRTTARGTSVVSVPGARTEVIPAVSAEQRDFYRAYMQSPEWRIHRNRALRVANYQCQRCGGKRDLQVHHRTYERLGREWDQDLEVLCDDCHRGHHIAISERQPLGLYLRVVRLVLHREPFLTIADLNADVKAMCAAQDLPGDPRLIERAIGLILGSQPQTTGPSSSTVVATTDEPLSYAEPCYCRECVEVGLGGSRPRRERPGAPWIHGDALRRWFDARAIFNTAVAKWMGDLATEPAQASRTNIDGAIPRENCADHDLY